MDPTHVLPDAVLWHEGMLLAPQHFQQASLRHEALVNYRVHAAAPFAWGVRHLRVELTDTAFRVTELEAVLPDGVVALVQGPADGALEADLDAHKEVARRVGVAVHLAVAAARRPGDRRDAGPQRFDQVEGSPVADENTGDGDLPVPRLRPRLTLQVGATVPPGYVSLPLARVAFRDGAFVSAPFLPPLLAARRGSELWSEVHDLAGRVREKALFFADRAHASAGRGIPAAEMRRAVRALVSELPRLEALLGLPAAHPLELYLAACAVAGRLAGVEARVPPAFPAYDHADPRATFEPVLTFCGRVLEALQEAFTAIPFHFHDGLYEVMPETPPTGQPLLVGVRPGALGESGAAEWMDGCRIASASRMASLADRRIRGAPRRRLAPTGELALAAGTGMVLFAVTPDAEFVVPGELLQVAPADEPARREHPAELVLYTPLGDGR